MLLLRFKPGTVVSVLDTRLLLGLLNLGSIMESVLRVTEITITSVNDGVHKSGSLHGSGRAVDIRCKLYDRDGLNRVVWEFKKLYDSEYDLIWESPGKPNEHLHLERDPGNINR